MNEWPAWMYHIGRFGRVEGQIFESADDVPPGWVDSPAKLKTEEEKKPRKRKARNGDGA